VAKQIVVVVLVLNQGRIGTAQSRGIIVSHKLATDLLVQQHVANHWKSEKRDGKDHVLWFSIGRDKVAQHTLRAAEIYQANHSDLFLG
jgi:hypothetical protein